MVFVLCLLALSWRGPRLEGANMSFHPGFLAKLSNWAMLPVDLFQPSPILKLKDFRATVIHLTSIYYFPPQMFSSLGRCITRLDDSNVLTIHRATLCGESVLPRYLSPEATDPWGYPAVYYPALDEADIGCGKRRRSE
jgi:hypothetical protein